MYPDHSYTTEAKAGRNNREGAEPITALEEPLSHPLPSVRNQGVGGAGPDVASGRNRKQATDWPGGDVALAIGNWSTKKAGGGEGGKGRCKKLPWE